MKIVYSLILLAEKLLAIASARSRRSKSSEREKEINETIENPEGSQSDLFGESSGRVSIDHIKPRD